MLFSLLASFKVQSRNGFQQYWERNKDEKGTDQIFHPSHGWCKQKHSQIGSQNGSQLILSSASISRFKYERSAFHSFVEWIPLLEMDECLRFFSPPFFKSKVRTSRHRWGSKWSISAWRGSSLLSPYSWALGRQWLFSQWMLRVRLNCTISRKFLVQVRRRLGSKTNENCFCWATRKTREQKKTVLNERAMISIVERNETSAQEGKNYFGQLVPGIRAENTESNRNERKKGTQVWVVSGDFTFGGQGVPCGTNSVQGTMNYGEELRIINNGTPEVWCRLPLENLEGKN